MIAKVSLALLAMQRQSWEHGVTMQAFLELGERDTVLALAKEAVHRAAPDGRPALIGASDGGTDPCCTGQALLYAHAQTGDPELGDACRALERWALHKAPRSREGIVYHLIHKTQFWVDSLYMLPPYLLAAGHRDEALRQFRGIWDTLYDPAAGLLSHMWDEGERRFVRRAFWGVGNGWACASLARMIGALPAGDDARPELIQKARGLISALLRYLRPDGRFHDVVDDPGTFPEVNLSQMVAYSVFRAEASGWALEPWHGAALRMRQAAQESVDAFGLVQGVCGAPAFDRPGTAAEGQAFYLLMESAFQNLEGGANP